MADMERRSWLIRKKTGTGPFDSQPASIVGPDTDVVGVVPEQEAEQLREALRELQVEVIEAADRIDHLDHRLNDGRVIRGKAILGGTEIQDECQALRELARAALNEKGKLDG